MKQELGKRLAAMYTRGLSDGQAMAMIILFGLSYAKEIRASIKVKEGKSLSAVVDEIIDMSGIRKGKKETTFRTEVLHGFRLARYAKPRRREKLNARDSKD